MVAKKPVDEPDTTESDEGTDDATDLEEKIRKVLGSLLGGSDVTDTSEQGGDDDDGKKGGKPARRGSQADVEDDAEAKVRAVLHKLKTEEEHAAEHARLKEAPKETTPQTVRKITQWMWGAGE